MAQQEVHRPFVVSMTKTFSSYDGAEMLLRAAKQVDWEDKIYLSSFARVKASRFLYQCPNCPYATFQENTIKDHINNEQHLLDESFLSEEAKSSFSKQYTIIALK